MTKRIALVLSFVLGFVSAIATVPIQGPTVVCVGRWPVSLQAPTGFQSYQWNTGATTNEIFITRSGTYTVVTRRSNGTVDTGTIIVREAPLPKPFIGNPIEYICRGDAVSLQAQSGFVSYLWNTGERTQSIRIDTAGFYRVTVTDTNGCVGSSDSLQVVVVERPKPNIYGPYTVCSGSTVLYKTENIAGAIYQWTTVGGQVTGTARGPTVRIIWPGGQGRVDVRVSMLRPDGGSCDTTVGLIVRIGSKLQPLLSFQSRMICQGDSTEFDAGGGFSSYRWSNGATTQKIMVKTAGSYWAELTDSSGCSGTSDTVTALVHPLPVVRIAGDSSLCDGEEIVLSAFATWNDVIRWEWSNGLVQRSIFVNTPGTYTVVGTTANGCRDSISKTILPAAQAVITAPDSLDFDSLEIGSGRFLPFLLENRTALLIRVLSARLASGRTNPALSVPSLPNQIPGNGDLTFVLSWQALIEGAFTDTLLIEIDGPECPSTVRIPIKGYAFFRPRVPVSISIGDTVVPVGTILDMPIRIRATAPRDEDLTLFEFSVSWNDWVYFVTGLDPAIVVSDASIGGIRTVRFRFTSFHFPIDTSIVLRGAVLLGSPLQTELVPDNVSITGTGKSVYEVTTDPGNISMFGCFLAGRLVRYPYLESTTVITNLVGETMACDIDELPSGSYILTTVRGPTVQSAMMTIVR
ncbi:MAG: hypothetical protein SGJ05_04075 [bacterium]|nr:hypothetical protein [bacterium]